MTDSTPPALDGIPIAQQVTQMALRLHFLEVERTRIAAVLKRFAEAELSLSSVQPVLKLSKELNP